MDKPTREQIDEARSRLAYSLQWARWPTEVPDVAKNIRILLAATTPPGPGPPRPADETALARLVAKELRTHGLKADHTDWFVMVLRWRSKLDNERSSPGHRHMFDMNDVEFDNLTPREIADVIQREEAAKAAEWAGDSAD